MTILDTIKTEKLKEVAIRKAREPIAQLEKRIYFERNVFSMKQELNDPGQLGLIAEFKRKSPSKGIINNHSAIETVTSGYLNAGVSGLSVLTDEQFFGANDTDFFKARNVNQCPMLRKDFIIDEYQIYETKAMGADVLLLIARMLTPKQISDYTKISHQLGLEVLLETHNEAEILLASDTDVDMVGINNRDLSSFEVSVENSLRLAQLLPKSFTKIAESGIESALMINQLKSSGFKGFLIGEYFMKDKNPSVKCEDLIRQLL